MASSSVNIAGHHLTASMQKYERLVHLRDKCIKTKWSFEEDEMLKEAVTKFGITSWYNVSLFVGSRSGKQCRERWIGQISPDLSKDNWNEEEDMKLANLQKVHGNKWTFISQFFDGRSPINIKNRWYRLQRHHPISQPSSEPETRPKNVFFKPLSFSDDRVFGEAFVSFTEQLLSGVGNACLA